MSTRWLDRLLMATLFVQTMAKIQWQGGGLDLTITNITCLAFVAAFLLERLRSRDSAMPRVCITLCGFMLAFLAVYLAGYFDLQTKQGVSFWAKGVTTWVIHFGFLITATAHILRRGAELFDRSLRWFLIGLVANAVYGLVQLVLVVGAGINLDRLVVAPLTAGQGKFTGIAIYGQVGGSQNIYRINGLTGDPNHLGVMLCVPLLMLLPRYLSDRRGHRRLGLLLVFLLTVQALTLSRSAALGDIVGLLVLAPTILPRLPRPRTLLLAVGVPIAALLLLYSSSSFVRTVISSRTNVKGSSVQTHFEFYSLVGPALDPNPLFGMGYNTFAVFYQFLTGKSDFGPHSFWVATLVETGVVGLTLYLCFFAWVMACALAMRHAVDADRRLLAIGLVAALVGTAAANFFYLTMGFDYFYVVLLLVIAGSALFAPARAAVSPTVAAPARAR
ncbi:MAG TPA: O-antigen ligase family protein [Gaiellales bacterium]|jgi:O-antigen ligase|nr:O-antigen ligase family protein [Gaiellales bacterium]